MTATPLTIAARRRAATSSPAHTGPRLSPPEWLLTLDDAFFAHQVTQDVRGLLRPERAEALRDARVLGRWAAVLRNVIERVEHDLEHADQFDPSYWSWATRTATFRRHALRRLNEAEALLAKAPETEVFTGFAAGSPLDREAATHAEVDAIAAALLSADDADVLAALPPVPEPVLSAAKAALSARFQGVRAIYAATGAPADADDYDADGCGGLLTPWMGAEAGEAR